VVERSQRSLIFIRERTQPFCEPVKLPGLSRLDRQGWILRSRLIEQRNDFRLPALRDEFQAHFDWSRLRGPFTLRSRRTGDRFHPLGMRGRCKLSDYFIDRKIPQALRDDVPLLVGRDGIIWVVGLGIGEPFKVLPETTKILRTRCMRGDER
jgi:tRNA(Ile)-lysidine synthase